MHTRQVRIDFAAADCHIVRPCRSCLWLECDPIGRSYTYVSIYVDCDGCATLRRPERAVSTFSECIVFALLDAGEDFDAYSGYWPYQATVTDMTLPEWESVLRTATVAHPADRVLPEVWE